MMNKCRICLRKSRRDLRDVTEINIFENGQKQSYKVIIMFCLGIQIRQDSTLSTKLCEKCYKRIILFYNFKTLAHKNDEFLRESAVWTNDDIKTEKETVTITNNDEPLSIEVKEENPFDLDDHNTEDFSNDIKYEFKQENNSDDEFLSVIKSLKEQPETDVKENAPVQKRKRFKATKLSEVLSSMELLAKKRKSKGVYEGVCEQCGKIYRDLGAHIRSHHPRVERPKVRCEHCDKEFKSNVLKRKHEKRKHFSVKQKCELCEKSITNLKLHMMSMHNKDALKFECEHCQQKFLTQARLNYHMKVHSKERPFKCDQCDSTFKTKLSLSNHKRQVHDKEKTHLCQFCSKSFFKKYHLLIHLRAHTDEKPHECPECGKHFRSTTSLKNHRLTHSGEKSVRCKLCDSRFVSKSYLANHMVSHRKEKRYPCQFCSMRFHRSDHRKRHEYTAHIQFTDQHYSVPNSYYVPKRPPQPKLIEEDDGDSHDVPKRKPQKTVERDGGSHVSRRKQQHKLLEDAEDDDGEFKVYGTHDCDSNDSSTPSV